MNLMVVDYSVELAKRAGPWWLIPASQITANVTAGICIAGGCGNAIDVRAGGVVEIFVGIKDAMMTSGDEWASIEKYPER
jgi:hypothetical protein